MDYYSHSLRDFHLFGPLKKHLVGRWFLTDTDMRQAVGSRVPKIETDFFLCHDERLVATVEKNA